MFNFFKPKPARKIEDCVTKKWKIIETELEAEESVFGVEITIGDKIKEHLFTIPPTVNNIKFRLLPHVRYQQFLNSEIDIKLEGNQPSTENRYAYGPMVRLLEPRAPVGTTYESSIDGNSPDWARRQLNDRLTKELSIEDDEGLVIHCNKIDSHKITDGPHLRQVKIKTITAVVVPVDLETT